VVQLDGGFLQDQLRAAVATQVPDVTLRRVEPGKQAVYLECDFDREFPEVPARIAGRVGFYTIPSIVNNELILRPALTNIRIRNIKYRGTVAGDSVVSVLNAALNTFINRINGQIQEQHIPLNIPLIKSIDPSRIFANTPNISNVTGAPVTFDIKIEQAVAFSEPGALHVLASLTPPFEAPPRQAPQMAANTDCSQPVDTALPGCNSNCGFDVRCIAEKVSCELRKEAVKRQNDLRQAEWTRRCAGATAVPVVDRDLEKSFDQLKKSFDATVQREFDVPPAAIAARSYVAVNRKFVAQVVNTGFRSPNVCGTYTAPFFRKQFSDDLLTPPPPDLRCVENARSCSINQPCDTHPCPERGCDSNCDWWDLGCHGRKLDCERLKAMEKGACEASEAAKKLACEADKELKRLDCERLKAMEIAGCRLNQEWLNAVGNTKVGRYDVTVEASGALNSCFQRLYVGEKLDQVELTISFIGQGHVGGPVSFVPANIGHIGCQSVVNGQLGADVLVKEDHGSFGGNVRWLEAGDGAMTLEIGVRPHRLSMLISPPPYDALMTQTNVRTACLPIGAFAGLTSALNLDLVPRQLKDGRFDIDLPGVTFPIRVEPVVVSVGGNLVPVRPKVTRTTLLFQF
jgi:hypothetical protein